MIVTPGPSIAIALFPGVEELDWIGPWQVLSAWARIWPSDGASVFTVAEDAGPITCSQGARVLADHIWDDVPPYDLLMWPGGPGVWPLFQSEAIRARILAASEAGVVLASVCTGSLLLANAGVLDGRPATTYWACLDDLGSRGKEIEVRPHDRFVDDGNIVTAAGVSAGIDMALHLVRRFHSSQRAREVRRFIQYDPEPPV